MVGVVREGIPKQERWALLLEWWVGFKETGQSGMMFQLGKMQDIGARANKTASWVQRKSRKLGTVSWDW